MPRDLVIQGETLVVVKGGPQLSGIMYPNPGELGLAVEDIRLTPKFIHKDINTDDFPLMAAETQWMLAEIGVSMNLIYWDKEILDRIAAESMAGGGALLVQQNATRFAWRLRGTGTLMGNGKALFTSGNHFMSLGLLAGKNQVLDPNTNTYDEPYRLRSAYLAEGYEIPLGVKASILHLNWRIIPYAPLSLSGDVQSSGILMLDRGKDGIDP